MHQPYLCLKDIQTGALGHAQYGVFESGILLATEGMVLLEKTQLSCSGDSLGAAAHAELAVDIPGVLFHRFR